MKCPKCNTENEKSAQFCHLCGAQLSHSTDIDTRILEIIEQNSYSKRILAAYEARKYANSLCKNWFGKSKKNYKEYVEMLIVQHYPKELDKANLGRKYLFWLWLSIALCFIGGIGFVISPFIIWKIIIPTYRQLKSMCI